MTNGEKAKAQTISNLMKLKSFHNGSYGADIDRAIKAIEQKQYEKHIYHTDCIWYGSDSGCPTTCSQYRDGWNDAMDYIFKNGKGYQPYRRDG